MGEKMEAEGGSFKRLKDKQRSIRENFPDNVGLRVHRAISWLQRAEKEKEDLDAAFIFYWVSFNAAYAGDQDDYALTGERSAFSDYFEKMISLDPDHEIYNAIWDKFSDSIRLLLDNKYVFQPFWKHHNRTLGYEDWNERFDKSKSRIKTAMGSRNTKLILTTLFDRLYVLRNQLIHGGATWNSAVNRSQVQDGATILAFLIPIFIDLMMDNPDTDWGAPSYPVVE
jgi:hypothetical protein